MVYSGTSWTKIKGSPDGSAFLNRFDKHTMQMIVYQFGGTFYITWSGKIYATTDGKSRRRGSYLYMFAMCRQMARHPQSQFCLSDVSCGLGFLP